MGAFTYFRQSTASQMRMIRAADVDAPDTAVASDLGIANTDVLIHKAGATSMVAKNSGGATYMSAGCSRVTFDATDTNTVGPIRIVILKAGAIIPDIEGWVLTAPIYDALFASDSADALATVNGQITAATSTTVKLPSPHDTGKPVGRSVIVNQEARLLVDHQGEGVYTIDRAWVTTPSPGDDFLLGDLAATTDSSAVATAVWAAGSRTITDKTGFKLASDGLDQITVESGANMRQAMAPILASAAGILSGAATSTIVVKGGGVATTRITATVDENGNRTAVTLNLPA